MEYSRPHRNSRPYSAGVLHQFGGRNAMQGDPDWRQSRQRVSGFSAPGWYSTGVPSCQSADRLTACLEVRRLADTGIAGRP